MPEAPRAPRESAYHVLKRVTRDAASAASLQDALAKNGSEQYEVVARDVMATRAKNAVEKHCHANKDTTDLAGTYFAMLASDWPVEAFPVTAVETVVVTIGGTA